MVLRVGETESLWRAGKRGSCLTWMVRLREHDFSQHETSVLAMLRAAWTPRSKRFGSRIEHPHRSPAAHDYAGEFEGIRPADGVRIAAKYGGAARK